MVYLIFSLLNNSLTQFAFINVVSGMRNYTAFYNSITKMMFVSFDVQLGNRATASGVAILNDHAHTIDGNAYMFPASAWDGVTGNIVLSYGYISGQDIKIYVPHVGILVLMVCFFIIVNSIIITEFSLHIHIYLFQRKFVLHLPDNLLMFRCFLLQNKHRLYNNYFWDEIHSEQVQMDFPTK